MTSDNSHATPTPPNRIIDLDPQSLDAAAISRTMNRGQLAVGRILHNAKSIPVSAISRPGSPGTGIHKHGGGSGRASETQIKARVVGPAQTWRSAPPDPTTAGTVAAFHAQLKQLKVWAGDLSLRDLAAKNPGHLSRSMLGDMFRRTDRLPKHALLHDYVLACGAGSEWPRWELAWQRLKNEAAAAAAVEAIPAAVADKKDRQYSMW